MEQWKISQTDPLIEKKKSKKKLLGSLGFRVFLICIILIALPLILHSVFLYKQEYRSKMRDVFIALNILGSGRAHLISQVVRFDNRFLDLMEGAVDSEEKISFENVTDKEFSTFLKKMSQITNITEIFFVSYNDKNQLVVQASSNNKRVGKDYSMEKGFMKTQMQKNYVFPGDEGKNMFVAKTVLSKDKKTTIGYLVMILPADLYVARLARMTDSPFDIDLSIVDENGHIFITSNADFYNKEIEKLPKWDEKEQIPNDLFLLTPTNYIDNCYYLLGQKEKFLSILVPIEDTEFALLLNAPVSIINQIQRQQSLYHLFSLLVFIVVIGGGGAFILVLRVSKPLKSLCSIMQKVAEGDIKPRFKKDWMGFEVNILGEYFNQMIDSLLKQQKEAEEQRLQRQILSQELMIGHEIQKSMFPTQLPEFSKMDSAAGFLPAKEVGGDFYDLFGSQIDGQEQLILSIADTSGKGISACLYSLSVRSMLRSFATATHDLKDIIKKTNDLFCKDAGMSGAFVTSWLGVYNPKTRELQYNSCGHYPALLRKSTGEVIELNVPGIAIGVEPFENVEIKKIKVESGDCLLLYTDGVIETMNEQKEFYGDENLKNFLNKNSNMPAKSFVKALISDLKHFSDHEAQYDDITLLMVRFL